MIDQMLQIGKPQIESLFKKFDIQADVNEENIRNAMKGVNGFGAELANLFEVENYESTSNGDSANEEGENNEDENHFFDNAIGKSKKKKKVPQANPNATPKLKLKDKVNNAVNTGKQFASKVNDLKNSASNTNTNVVNTNTPAQSTNTIMGMNPYLFYGVIVIIILIILYFVFK